MKEPRNFLTNTLEPAGRELGEAKNNPGDNSGTGVDHETYNDVVYAELHVIEKYKNGGNSGTDETLVASDMNDALEELVNKKVSGIDEYNPVTNYILAGEDLIMWKGFQFVNILDVTNQAKDPLLNPASWLKIPSPDKLMDYFYEGAPIDGGLNPVSDRAGSQYLQNFSYGKYRLGENGDTFGNFSRVNLDGTVLTGNADLEAIFDVGGGNQYFNLDLIAPDNLGTRTLIDMSSRHIAPQSSGGDNDVLGAVLADRMQGHQHVIYGKGGQPATLETPENNFLANTGVTDIYTSIGGLTAMNSEVVGDPETDNTNGTPRTGQTTRPKEFTVGSSYIIVMVAV